jgi:mxaJ protein
MIKRVLLIFVALSAMVAGRAMAQTPLRVCADPDYLPFSNRAGQGFENKVAASTAALMGRKLQYTWATTRSDGGFEQFVHDTLDAHKCDLIVDVPYAVAGMLTTRPYYISSYVFLYKKSKDYDLRSMDSPVLHHVKIGYEADTPAEGGLQIRALTPGALPFEVADREGQSPAVMLDAIENNRINVAITWEPSVGYFLRSHPEIAVVTIPNSRSQGSPEQYTFPMAMGVRSNDTALQQQLNNVIQAHQSQLQEILRNNGVRFYQPEVNP